MLFGHLFFFFFSKSSFSKNSFRNAIRVANSLDPDQARHLVGPDLGPNCLQKLSAEEDTSRQRVNMLLNFLVTVKVVPHECVIRTDLL